MISNILDQLAEIDPSMPLSLAVGWTSGKNLKIRQMILGGGVEAAFREVIANTLADLAEREPAEWTPDADLTPETFLLINAHEVGDSPTLTSDHEAKKFLEVLAEAERLEAIHPKYLPAGDLVFYSIVVGNPGSRSAFIRRANPRRGLKRGRILFRPVRRLG